MSNKQKISENMSKPEVRKEEDSDKRSRGTVLFLEEVVRLSKEYGLVLTHEDHEGAFVVMERSKITKKLADAKDDAVLRACEG